MNSLSRSAENYPDYARVPSNGIEMAVLQSHFGDPSRTPILFLHGFPELAYSWRFQLKKFSKLGYGVAAPDLRGYGKTGPRGPLESYSLANLARDVIGILDAFEVSRTVLVGHDFGGALAWTLARDYPDRIMGVASLNTPYTRRTEVDLVRTMRSTRGPNNYMVEFQAKGPAEKLLGQDVRATFSGLMRCPKIALEKFSELPANLRALPPSVFLGDPMLVGAPFLASEEIDVYVKNFEATGFEGALNWYRNLNRNWLDTAHTVDLIDVPSLMISAADDYFLPPTTTRGMESIVRDLERKVIADCGHWTQQERPDAVNSILHDWIERRLRRIEEGPVSSK